MADEKQPQAPLTPLDEKILRVLSDRVILKPLTRWNEAYKEFPRFVMEYLVSRYIDPADPLTGQHKIDKILTEHYSESAKKELIKSRIKERGQYTLLGQLTVRLDQGRDHYWASVPALGDDTVRVSQKVLAQYADVLMTSGAWGTMEMEYDGTYDIKGRKFPFYIREFTPLQYTRLNLDDFVEKRSAFTDDEWLDLLVQSIGFNPTRFDRRVKLLMLMRIVPFVESNFNLIELGPRETGKTYTFRNTSSRSFVVSGGNPTPATLFYNKASRKLGVVGMKHVVFVDEIANARFDDEASISMLKDYMQTGKFTRGDQEFSAPCSIVLGGNIDTNLELRQPQEGYKHLFQVLPVELQDPAFLDRIHAYLPGWEMPKIRPELFHRLRPAHGLHGGDFLGAAAAQLPDARERLGGLGCHDGAQSRRREEDDGGFAQIAAPAPQSRHRWPRRNRLARGNSGRDAQARDRPVGQDSPRRIH